MEANCTSSNREMILHVMQREAQGRVVYHASPSFSCSVNGYLLRRDGVLSADEDRCGVFSLLASLGLCDQAYEPPEPPSDAICYPARPHTGRSLLNLFSIVSSRQALLNCALAAPRSKAFHVAPSLMDDLLAHPPTSVAEFVQALYGRGREYRGMRIDLAHVELTGFRRCPRDEDHVHRQLADRIIETALTLKWAKPYTKNVRNRKYAFRTWLNAIGMSGPAYAEARQVMLDRLYGWTDRRGIRR